MRKALLLALLALLALLLLVAACRDRQSGESLQVVGPTGASGNTISIHALPPTDDEYAVMTAAGASPGFIYT